MKDEEVEGAFLKSLFEALKEGCEGYCVLRNYATLPDSLGGSDLDLAILPDEKEKVARLVIETAKKFGGEPIVDYISSGRFIRLLGCFEGVWWGAAIDLFWMMEYRGLEYIPSCEVIERAGNHRGIAVARDDDAAVIALVKELLSNGKTRKDYFPQLADLYAVEKNEALHLMRHSFSPKTIRWLALLLSQRNDGSDVILPLVKSMRKDVYKLSSEDKKEGQIKNFLWRFYRVFKPVGVTVAVLGTDGSGKTTLIDGMTSVLERAIHNTLEYNHLRPNWLPALGVATGKRQAGDGGIVRNPHGQKPSGFIGSMVRLAYYSIDYTAGYWLKIFPHLVKRPHISLFDRYYFDFIIDPRRMRIALPRWILRLAFMFAPKPDIILCLGGSSEIIFGRKPETSLEEVERQVQELKGICLSEDRAFWVDTTGSVEESVSNMLFLIKGMMSGRYK